MNNYLTSLFRDSGLSEADISKCTDDLSQVFFLSLLGEAESRLSDGECSEIKEFVKKGEIEKALTLIKSKFEQNEFKILLQKILRGVLEEYRNSVLA